MEIRIFHIIARAARRGLLFLSEDEFQAFLDVLRYAIRRFDLRLLSFCLLLTHYHLLVAANRGTVSRAMKFINFVLTRLMNKRHDGSGHLLEAPFKAFEKTGRESVLSTARYVMLNALDAAPPEGIEGYRWSSYGDLLGLRPPRVHLDLLGHFGSDLDQARKGFRAYMREGIPDFLAARRRKAQCKAGGMRLKWGTWQEDRFSQIASTIEALRRTISYVPTRGSPLSGVNESDLLLWGASRAGFGPIRKICSALGQTATTGHRRLAQLQRGMADHRSEEILRVWLEAAFGWNKKAS